MTVAISVLFVLTAASVSAGLSVYLYRRLVRDVTSNPAVRRAAAVGFGLLFLGIPVLRAGFRTALPPWLGMGLAMWWGAALYLVLALAVFDAALWMGRRLQRRPGTGGSGDRAPRAPESPARRQFVSRLLAAGATVSSASAVFAGVNSALRRPEVTEVLIRLPRLPKALEGFTIVHLSDLHIGALIRQPFIDQLVDVANAAGPDLVAITGDLVDGSVDELGATVARLTRLRARYGTHFVSGNHDYYSGWDDWAPALTSLGLNVLRNRRVVIGTASGSFDLLGVDDYGSRWISGGYDLEAALAGWSPDRPSVLLAHQPRNLEAVAKRGVGLQLSGHTHGGQLFPGTIVGAMAWGDRNRGLSRTGDTWLYTSRGCGFVGPPMRLGAAPEVVKIVLLTG